MMDLDFGIEGRKFRSEIRAWIGANVPTDLVDAAEWRGPAVGSAKRGERRAAAAEDDRYKEWEGLLLDAGLICPSWPKKYGGGGLSPIELMIFEEECQRIGVPRIERGMGERMVGPAILVHGTEEQKAHFLPRIVRGIDVYCQGYSEPDFGSDLANVQTRGVVDGDEIVVTGQKTWTSGAHRANMIFLICRTDPQARGHRGLSYVLAPFSAENGVEVRPVKQMNGASNFCEDFFTTTRAPLFNVIGGLNNGWAPAMTTLGFERGGKATVTHLGFEVEFWDLVEEAREKRRLEEPLIRERLARAFIDVSLIRYIGMRMASVMASGSALGPEASITKVFRTEYHRRFGELALHVRGAAGLLRPEGEGYATGRWQDVFLSTRAGTIYSGTSEIQRNIIGERVLGLPRGPRGGRAKGV